MIEALRETIIETPGTYIMWCGFLIGLVFGFIVNRTNFCSMGSISDIVNFGDYRRMRAWLLAAAVALIGAQFLQANEVTNLSTSLYMQPSFGWLGHVVGGLMFGFGMVLSGGCVSRNLVRVGGGNIGSLVVLIVIGLFAYMTIGGIIGPVRQAAVAGTALGLQDIGIEIQGLDAILTAMTGAAAGTVNLLITAAIAAAVLIYCFKDKDFRTSPPHIIAGVGIGLCVMAGWALTGLAFDDLADTPVPVISLSFVRPSGDTLDYLTRFTALGLPGFGVVTLFGTILGSFLAAIMTGRFRLAGFADTKDTMRNLGGAALMGIGGVAGLGCTIGQAVTGVSTLAIGSFVTFLFIAIGGYAGIKYMEWRIMQEV